jgi:hypothetical protein
MQKQIQAWFENEVLPNVMNNPEIFGNGRFLSEVDYWEMNENLMVDLNIFTENGMVFICAYEMKTDIRGQLYTDTDGAMYVIDCVYK